MGVVKVHGVAASPYVATVLLCLEEAGAAYEVAPLDMAAREQRTQPHLARNPFGKIPAFEDGDLVLFGNHIMIHKYGGHLAVRAPQVRRRRPAAGGRPRRGGGGGRVGGGGGAPVPPGGRSHRAAVPHRAPHRRRPRPARRGRERREAPGGAGGVRGAAEPERVPRRRLPQPRRPRACRVHALPHGDGVRGAGGGAPQREGVVGAAGGEAGGEEGHRAHARRLRYQVAAAAAVWLTIAVACWVDRPRR